VPEAPDDAPGGANPTSWLDRLPAIWIGLAVVGIALAAYWLPGSTRFFNHFVWQALAFLDGRAAITWPVDAPGLAGNAYFQDVFPVLGPNGERTGYGLLPFPPLPAIVLVPFVAIWGLATDQRLVSVGLGAIGAGLAWWMLGRLAVSRAIRLATTAFFALGTVFWYAAQLGTTWFLAHVVAVTCLLLAVGTALGGDPRADDEVDDAPSLRVAAAELLAALRRPLGLLDGRQLLAGFLFGLACTARLSIVFGAPFFVFVGSGGSWVRRSVSAGLGAAIPIGLLLAYNLATTGHVVHPGYDYLYHLEASGYPGLHYNPAWSLEDIRYLPQNLRIMFLSAPVILPDVVPSSVSAGRALCADPGAVRGLFDLDCPLALPRDVGMSLLLTSPAYLLGLAALVRGRSRLVVGATIAVVAIAVVNLMHFSQGWVQFGYRFSNDFVVFAVLLVAVGMARRGGVGLVGLGLIGLSIVVNAWGVIWGNLQGW
jgi:hypothetical protein